MDHAGDVAIGDERDRPAGLAHPRDQVGMARAIEDERGDLGRRHALRLGEVADVLLGRRVEIDHALGIAGADRDLLHIDVGRMQQRSAFGHGDGGDRAGHVLGAQSGAFERIDRDIHFRPPPVAHPLADEKHGRLVELALADDDGAVDRQLVELAPHGVDGGLVGGLLGAAAAQARRRDRRALGHAHDLDRENALQDLVRLDGNRRHGLAPLFQSPGLAASIVQFFSIRMTCGLPEITLSRPTAASARRTASSVVA